MHAEFESSIRIEFYGIPRQRAGVAETAIDLAEPSLDLATILTVLAERYPDFGRDCVFAGRLRTGYLANVSGEQFVTDPTLRLQAGDCLLIMTADAGG